MNPERGVYSGFGLTIESELPLPELQAGRGEPDIVIRKGHVTPVPRRATLREQVISGTLSGRFRIREGREIMVDPLAGAEMATVRLVLLGRVMACLLSQRGWLPLHASAVTVGGEAALFVGSSGSGKSTMAAAMHARGHAVLADDIGPVKVDGNAARVLPMMSRVRLLPDSLRVATFPGASGPHHGGVVHLDKFVVDLARPRTPEPIRVKRIYLLAFGSRSQVIPLPALAAIASLGTHCFGIRQESGKELAEVRMRTCVSLEKLQVVRTLARTRDLDCLEGVVRLVEEDMASGG